MLIRSLPTSLSFLCTFASAQPDMTVETLAALIRAELDRKKNPNNFQGLNRNTSVTPKANQAKNQKGNGQRFNQNGNKGGRKKGNCHHCGKYGHFKRVCRKRLHDRNRQYNNQPNNATNPNKTNNQNQCNNFGFNNRNNSNNSNNQGNISQSKNDIQTMVNQTLVSALRNFSSSNAGSQPTFFNHSFGGFLASIKFRSNLAESSTVKVDDA